MSPNSMLDHPLVAELDVAAAASTRLLQMCADVASVVAAVQEEKAILDRFVQSIARHLDSAAACCWQLDFKSKTLRPAARIGCDLPFDGLNEPVPMGKTAIGEVAANRMPLIVSDLRQNPDSEVREWAKRTGITSFAALPIETDANVFGVVAAFRKSPFEETTLFALNTVQRMVAVELERRATSAETHRSNEFLQTFVHSAPVAVVGFDSRQAVTLWNQEAERAFGWTRGDVVGRRYSIAPETVRDVFDEHVRSVLGRHFLKPIETVRQHADGRLIPVMTAMSPVYDENNNVEGIVEILTDLTRQKHAERCLRTQAALSNSLANADSLGDAAERTIQTVGEKLGWRCGEVWLQQGEKQELNRVCFHALKGGDCERFASALSQHDVRPGQGIIGGILANRDAVFHADLSRVADSPRAVLGMKDGLTTAIGVPIVVNESQRGCIAFFGENIPEPDASLSDLMANVAGQFAQFLARHDAKAALRTAEDNLRQSQKMDAIGLLAGGVAHDFNNILAVIIAYSELALDEVDEDHSLREPLAEIQNAGQRAASLTRQLLAFSRKQVFEPTEVDLNKLSEDMDKMLRRLVGANIVCESNLSRPLYRVKADAAQLEQVLLNLVVNARDAMPAGGRILIETRNADLDARSMPARVTAEPGSFAVLSVTDTGCGMDEATQARIFEPFFTTKAPGKGTGMGLSTVYGIVQQSGGFITVNSQVGKGTTFSVYFPRVKELLATQQIDVLPSLLPAGSGTILVVENDDTVRAVVRRVLELRGYAVVEARHGGEAIAILTDRSREVGLVITDILMPVLDGLSLSRRIKTEFPQVKVLFMSGFASLPNEDDNKALEGSNFLQKPFTSDALIRKVHTVLAG